MNPEKPMEVPGEISCTGEGNRNQGRDIGHRKRNAVLVTNNASESDEGQNPTQRKKKENDDETKEGKRWEEEKKDDGIKWKFLEHKGPVFAPPYEPLPPNVLFFYDGKEVRLSQNAEEVAGFYAQMLDHDYTTKSVFNDNFFKDWRKVMTDEEQNLIKDLSKCNFKKMQDYFQSVKEKNEKDDEIQKEYGFCIINGRKEKLERFKIEPPGLFKGNVKNPNIGMLKMRVMPEDVIINCSKDSKIPKPPPGHEWKEVKHDNTVEWLASWTENVQSKTKYVYLACCAALKHENDKKKYNKARELHNHIVKIRKNYAADWEAEDMHVRQCAVALYFIDKLVFRAGNEKDDDQADAVGCCSLRVEHIKLHEEKDGEKYVVVFDFIGKGCIKYNKEVPVEERVFNNLKDFIGGKKDSDDLFDTVTPEKLNEYLKKYMPGLTAKVFRTYNASLTMQEKLGELTNEGDLKEKLLAFDKAILAVALLCNHQRAVCKDPKDMKQTKKQINKAEENLSIDPKLEEQRKMIHSPECAKLNYIDPRIVVAWCKKHEVPLENIYNKTQRDKFRWAIDMAGPDYVF